MATRVTRAPRVPAGRVSSSPRSATGTECGSITSETSATARKLHPRPRNAPQPPQLLGGEVATRTGSAPDCWEETGGGTLRPEGFEGARDFGDLRHRPPVAAVREHLEPGARALREP